MRSDTASNVFNKTLLSCAVTTALGVGLGIPAVSNADIYEFTFMAGTVAGIAGDKNAGSTGGSSEPIFTMLNAGGNFTTNNSYPYYGDATWGYGKRSQIVGSIVIDDGNDLSGTVVDGAAKGTMVINGFDFFAKGPAVASDVKFKDVLDADDPDGAAGHLMLTNMTFSWNGSVITTQVVLDAAGIFAEFPTASVGDVFDATTCAVSGACALPASNDVKNSAAPIGLAPIATSSYNTVGQTGAGSTLGQLSLGADDGTGGSPMDNGAFSGSNANFDFSTIELVGYNDTTAPTLLLGGSGINTVNLTVGDVFDINNPGVTVTCSDAADGADVLTAAPITNDKIDFNIDNGNGGSTAPITNMPGAGTYEILYTCIDSASDRAAISDDPGNSGNPTDPIAKGDNESVATTVLTVNVVSAGQPVISITNGSPTSHEACTVYTDAGATFTDPEDGGPFTIPGAAVSGVNGVSTVTDATPIIGVGNEPNEGSYSIVYNAEDLGGNPASPQTRTVNVSDTAIPIITINRGNGTDETVESTGTAAYVNPSATVIDDNSDCNAVVGTPTTTDIVDFVVPDGFDSLDTTLRYFASDSSLALNQAQKNFVVTVERAEPVITLLDELGTPNGGGIVLDLNEPYVEFGMLVHDVQDGDVSATSTGSSTGVGGTTGGRNISYTIDSSAVDVANSGSYDVIYTAIDFDTNTATQVTRTIVVGATGAGSNFTMLNSAGTLSGGTNDILFVWDGVTLNTDETDTTFGIMTIETVKPQPYESFFWTAHNIRVYGPGNYSFDTSCTTAQYEAGTTSCGGSQFITMTVGADQIGAHILFDWGKPDSASPCAVKTCDIDVVNVWNKDAAWDRHGGINVANKLWDRGAGIPPDPDTLWALVSTDVTGWTDEFGVLHAEGDGINGAQMVDGPFEGFHANFNSTPATQGAVPPPVKITSPDTELGGSLLASVSITSLFMAFFSLLGLRQISQKPK